MLGVGDALEQGLGAVQHADTQPGRDALGGAADVDGALRGERGERRRSFGRQPAVDFVLDHDQVVPAGERHDRLAPRQRHGGGGRVVHGRIDDQQARAGGPPGRVEGVRQHAFVVQSETMQADPAALGDVADAGIGQSLGQHGVAGPGERGERDHDRLMRAAGDDRALRRCIEPDPGDPARGGRAMLRKALLGRVRPQVGRRSGLGRDLGESLGNQRAVASVRRALTVSLIRSPEPSLTGLRRPVKAAGRRTKVPRPTSPVTRPRSAASA